jgi:hypothetical protein
VFVGMGCWAVVGIGKASPGIGRSPRSMVRGACFHVRYRLILISDWQIGCPHGCAVSLSELSLSNTPVSGRYIQVHAAIQPTSVRLNNPIAPYMHTVMKPPTPLPESR